MTQRALGTWTCTALVVGNTLGLGIFMLPAALAPFGLNAVWGWLAVVAGCLGLALVFARLARAMPDTEPYGYLQRTLGDAPAFLALWAYWVSVWVTNAALAIGVSGYLGALVPALAQVPPAWTGLVLVALATAVNLLGVRAGGGVQLATTVLKLLPMAVVIGLGLWLLARQPAAFGAQVPTTPVTMHGTAGAATLALFAMLGIESASLSAARARDPQRTIARATVLGTVLTGAVSLAVCTLPLLLLPQAHLAASGAPFALLLQQYLGAGAGRGLALFVVISGLGALNGWTLLAGEVTRSMATRGVFPRVFARQNRHGAPAAALLGCGVLTAAMVAMGGSRALVEGFTFLSNLTTLATLPLYLGCALALLALWRHGRRTAATLASCMLGLGLVAFAVYGASATVLWMTVALLLAGLPLYLLARRRGA